MLFAGSSAETSVLVATELTTPTGMHCEAVIVSVVVGGLSVTVKTTTGRTVAMLVYVSMTVMVPGQLAARQEAQLSSD